MELFLWGFVYGLLSSLLILGFILDLRKESIYDKLWQRLKDSPTGTVIVGIDHKHMIKGQALKRKVDAERPELWE